MIVQKRVLPQEKSVPTGLNPVLFDNTKGDAPQVVFILEKHYAIGVVERLYNNVIRPRHGPVKIKILSPLCRRLSPAEEKTDVGHTYYKNRADFNKVIPPNTPVVAFGRAVYSITYGTTLQASFFYDVLLPKSSFYSPQIKCEVFLIDRLSVWNGQDCFYRKFALEQIRRAFDYKPSNVRLPKLRHIVLSNPNEELTRLTPVVCKIAIDTETTGLNAFKDRPFCVTFAMEDDPYTSYYIDWDDLDVEVFSKFIANKFIIGQNLKFDIKMMRSRGVTNLKIDADTWALAHCLNEMRSNGLKTLSWLYSNYGGYEYPLDEYKKRYPKVKDKYHLINRKLLIQYACNDTSVTMLIYTEMLKHLKHVDQKLFAGSEWNLSKYYDLMIESTNTFVDIEMEGMCIDWDRLKENSIALQQQLAREKLELQKEIGDWINVNSTEQLGKALEHRLELPEVERTVKKVYKVNKDTLHEWSSNGYGIADKIQRYNSLSTVYGTFVGKDSKGTGYYQYKCPDEKVHSTFGVMLTNTGRNRSKDPNLQNIPKHAKSSKLIRSVFTVPGDEYIFAEFDGASFQLRIMAALSGDPVMKQIFTELSGDMHSVTAVGLFRQDLTLEQFLELKNKGDKAVKAARQDAKAPNFGFIFGAGAVAFCMASLKQTWSIEKAGKYVEDNKLLKKVKSWEDKKFPRDTAKYLAASEDIREKFFQTYDRLGEYLKEQIDFATKHGYVVSPFGAVRRLPELLHIGRDSDKRRIKHLQNVSLNSAVQNFEAVLIMKTINAVSNYIKRNGLKSKLVGTVHDSIVLYLHRDEVDIISQEAKRIFEENIPQNNGIPQELEIDLFDITRNGDVWGFKNDN